MAQTRQPRPFNFESLEHRALMASDLSVVLDQAKLSEDAMIASAVVGSAGNGELQAESEDDVLYMPTHPFYHLVSFLFKPEYTLELSVVNLRTGEKVLPTSHVLEGDLIEVKLVEARDVFVGRALAQLDPDPHFKTVEGRRDLIQVTASGPLRIAFTPKLDGYSELIAKLSGIASSVLQSRLEELLKPMSLSITANAASAHPLATDEAYWYKPFDDLDTARDAADRLKRPDALALSIDASHGLIKNNSTAQPLKAVAVTNPARGKLVLNDDGSFTYAVDSMSYDNTLYDFVRYGDEFSYALISPQGVSDVHKVRIEGASFPLLDLNMKVVDADGKAITSAEVGQEFYLEISAFSNNVYRVAPPHYQFLHPLNFDYKLDSAKARFEGAPTSPKQFEWERYSLGQENGKLLLNSEIVGPNFVVDPQAANAFFDRYNLEISQTLLLRQKLVATQAGQLSLSVSDAFLRLEDVDVYAVHTESISLELIGDSSATAASTNRLDVSGNGTVSPFDVLLIVNRLNSPAESEVSAAADAALAHDVCDVNGDGLVTPIDALLVVNWLNTASTTAAEGEASDATISNAAVDLQFASVDQEQPIKKRSRLPEFVRPLSI